MNLHLIPFLIAVGASSPKAAQSGLRWAAVVQDAPDTKASGRAAAEAEIVRALLDAGLVFVDPAQADKIRSVTDAGAIIAGHVPGAITTLDADMIIAAVVKLTRVESEMLGKDIVRFNGIIDAKVIRVDNAELIASLTVKSQAMGLDADRSAHNAAQIAGGELAKKILVQLPDPKISTRIEISIDGIPDVACGEAILEAVGKLPKVRSTKFLRESEQGAKIAVEVSGSSARALAVALQSADIPGLRVFGYSDTAIKAEYSPALAARLKLHLGLFDDEKKSPHDAWKKKALPEMIGTALSRSTMLVLGVNERTADASSAHDGVVLTGSFRAESSRVQISAKLMSPSLRIVIAALEKSCDERELASCADQMGTALEEAFRRGYREKVRAGAQNDRPLEARPLAITKVAVSTIFPSRLAGYSDQPIGTIHLENRGKDALDDLVLSAGIEGFTSSPVTSRLGRVEGKASLDAPIRVLLDKDALVSLKESASSALTVDIEYALDGYRIRETSVVPAMIHDKHAMSWREASSAAAFVTPQAEDVLRLARAMRNAISEEPAHHSLAAPIALFRGLGDRRLRYAPDPSNPYAAAALDYLQYPLETLQTGSGDCDDLAVLYSAFAEAVGIRTLLITSPDHVFVAVPTKLPERSAHVLSAHESDFLVHEGQLWVPVETTKIGSSFEDAWAAGAREVERWKKSPHKLAIVDLHEAWKSYPAANLSSGTSTSSPDLSTLGRRVEAELASIEKRRKHDLEDLLRSVERAPVSKRARAIKKATILAQAGRGDEAKLLLEDLAKAGADPTALNDLGNVHLEGGRPAEALALYRSAIAKTTNKAQVPIRINAALASLVLGDQKSFGDQIVVCLEMGAEKEVLDLARTGYSGSPNQRGSGEPMLLDRDLSAAVLTAYGRAKRAPPPAIEERQKGESGELREVGRYVYWLAP
jgi:tetratricopeptide (TPR) repeat protein